MRLPFIFLLSLPTLCFAQHYAVGETSYQTKLYKRPVSIYEADKDSLVRAIVKNGSTIFCYNALLERSGEFVKVIYKKDTGYIQSKAVKFKQGIGSPLKDISAEHEPDNYKAALAYQKDYEKLVADSEMKFIAETNAELELTEIRAKQDSLEKARTALNIVKQGFGILEFGFPSDDYSAGLRISVMNMSKKTIKYLWVSMNAYNAVDDIIGTKTVQCVGPIPYQETGSYEFENVFYTRVFDSGKLTKLRIQYMDGTTKEIVGKAISSIIY